MKTIAYYISDYGYGHASRSIAVIRQLLENVEIRIVVCHSFALSFIKASLNNQRVSYRKIQTDIGYYLEKDSIYPDKIRLFDEYQSFVSNWDYYIQEEQEFLKQNSIDLVVSDISPLPFEAADRLGIPSVGLSNFTWYTAYQGLIEEHELNTYKEAYQKMSYYFSLAGNKEQWNVKLKEYGFFSREVDAKEVQSIRTHVNPNGNHKVIFLGLGMKINVGTLEQLPIWDSPNCVFIVSSNVQVDRANVIRIPSDYVESQNYIAASDLVISKAGWGMIGEALGANVPLLIIDRPFMKEDQNTIQYLKQRQLCETIGWEALLSYQVDPIRLERLEGFTSHGQNEAKRIAIDLIKLLH